MFLGADHKVLTGSSSCCLVLYFSPYHTNSGHKIKCYKTYKSHPEILQFSHSVLSDSLWPHGLQHTRPPCPSQTPRIYSNSSPLSWWCHPTISSSVTPFSTCPQSFPASGSFPMSQLFVSDGQSIGVSEQPKINSKKKLIKKRESHLRELTAF